MLRRVAPTPHEIPLLASAALLLFPMALVAAEPSPVGTHLLPHVFEVSGTRFSPAGECSISGMAIAESAGKVQLLAISQTPGGTPGFASLAGTVSVSQKQNVLKGFETTGQPIKISLRR